jgi:cell division protease FtsH
MMMDRLVHERQYSDDTAKLIDDEVESLIAEAAERARQVIRANMKKLEELKIALLEKETVESDEVKKIFDGTVMPKVAALY